MNICRRKVAVYIFLCFFPCMPLGTASAVSASNTLSNPFSAPGDQTTFTPYGSLGIFQEQLEKLRPGMMVQTEYHGDNHVRSLAGYSREFIPDLIGGSEKIFSRDNLTLALIGGALAGLSANVDHVDRNIKNYFQTRRPLDGVSKYGDMIGQGYYHMGVGAALFAAGELSNNKKLADTGIVTLEAFLINGIATEGLKYTTHRLRPNGGDHMSFPSGHASSTAAVAASISAMYDWDPAIAVPLYATAIFVGTSRIQDNMHYLSDVIAGLTIGTIVGRSVAGYHREKDSGVRIFKNVSFLPLLEKDVKGGVFTMKW